MPQQQIHIVDEQLTNERAREETEAGPDVEDVDVRAPGFYDEAAEPDWSDVERQTAAFMRSVLQELGKDEFLNSEVHHFEQLDQLRVVDWVHRQHQRVPTPEYVPEWDELQDLAGEILVRGTLRHRENDHFVERLGETWHVAETHDMDVYTADEFDRVFLD